MSISSLDQLKWSDTVNLVLSVTSVKSDKDGFLFPDYVDSRHEELKAVDPDAAAVLLIKLQSCGYNEATRHRFKSRWMMPELEDTVFFGIRPRFSDELVVLAGRTFAAKRDQGASIQTRFVNGCVQRREPRRLARLRPIAQHRTDHALHGKRRYALTQRLSNQVFLERVIFLFHVLFERIFSVPWMFGRNPRPPIINVFER